MSSEIEEILDEVDQQFRSFKSFEVVSYTPKDNHFVIKDSNRWQTIDRQFLCGTRKSKAEQETSRVNQFTKRMKQEWKILEDNLPNSVYVRAYEKRIDIMRAAVISIDGSPYSYGLFFFDIFFPRDYPSKPPQLYHHPIRDLSNINPSTSSNYMGDNCTILCNNAVCSTWDSKTSNVYSMMGVIQGKVLMNWNIYSKDVGRDLWLSHMAMLSFLKYPPVGFDEFVKGYFRKYSHNILLKFKGKGGWDEKSASVSRMLYMLYNAFEMNGSYCKHLANVVGKEKVCNSTPWASDLGSQESCESYRSNSSSIGSFWKTIFG